MCCERYYPSSLNVVEATWSRVSGHMISINCRQEPVGWVMRVCVDQPLVTIVVFSVMFAYAEGKLKYRADKTKAIDGDLR